MSANVFEISSDSSEDTIIMEKYLSNTDELIDAESLDVDSDFPQIKKSKKNISDGFPSQCENDKEILQLLSEKYKKTSEDHFLENVEPSVKERKNQKKIEERERKKREAECEKALKGALAASKKNLKPTECRKFISVLIDNDIMNEPYGNDIINALQAVDVKYKTESQIFPRTITWSRQTQSHLMNDDGKLISSSTEEDTNYIITIMNCREFLDHVNNETLCAHIQSIKSVLVNKKITLAIYDLQSYNRYQKNKKYNEMRTQLTQETERSTSNNHLFRDFPNVSKGQIELALTELELLCSCSHRMVDSGPELGQMVAQFTKSVAEIPYKQQRHKYQTEWFVAGDNRDCVNVDKDGNGLGRLWKQTLTTFPLASLETAEAISLKYPNVSALMKAYDECRSKTEAELLLQDIPIRRAAGPLSSARKIGPELSRKVFNFFTSKDGEGLL
ncbi:crossover junction endonuclease EME1 isoform X2 [Tribolium castaneum]|uniref:crossover junction endonuclease EME1 isoform X2 n=1 Tax=Tribolium castaneum TaxID=7070 RepID=UPI00046C3AF9|nr:PREDICTED: crossover junction endonuclease EME1 isoform X2 [Tribolium castaneum]|eukprot:XP_008201573.1 PREDICTED: crossover junction endonuclease EME1 isoform X2 [Tribolium castaneum]